MCNSWKHFEATISFLQSTLKHIKSALKHFKALSRNLVSSNHLIRHVQNAKVLLSALQEKTAFADAAPVATPSSPSEATPVDINSLDPYIHTLSLLREAVVDLVAQVRGKDPHSSPTFSELHSPDPDYVSPSRTAPACHIETYAPQNPFFERHSRWFNDLGCTIDGPLLTALSYGRVSSRPWEPYHTLDDIAVSVAHAEQQDPGALDPLCDVLFPEGVFNLAAARVPTRAAVDLIEGWLWLMEEHMTGQVPQLKARCQCGSVVRSEFPI
ncbi:Copia-like polyprotein/retrotransposon [Ceratobasidium sp. AG-Ba]|nr:Copia-like polyprotein/retrotransposon [Ceratobasidium sp. AG-Ba]